MKKYLKLFFFLLISASSTFGQVSMQDIRNLFAVSNIDEDSNNELIDLTENYSMLSNPVLYGYYAAGIMAKANYTFWPPSKLDFFNEGKVLLEKVIERYPDNIELRFVRYNVQNGVPDFLEYNANLAQDKKIVLDGMTKLNWPAYYKKEITEYLKSN